MARPHRGNASQRADPFRLGKRYIPVGLRPKPVSWRRIFLVHRRNTSYNALEVEVTHRSAGVCSSAATILGRKISTSIPALTGAQANNQAQMVMDRTDLRRDWGPSWLNTTNQGSISRDTNCRSAKASTG